jgi:hypothetical protein
MEPDSFVTSFFLFWRAYVFSTVVTNAIIIFNCLCSLFNDALSVTQDCIASNERTTGEC